jgi:hypothetical protein
VVVAGLARWAVGLFVADVVPFATFFPATLIASLVGGTGPGIFAAISGGVIGWWAFIGMPMTWLPLTAGQQVSIVAYFITSLISSGGQITTYVLQDDLSKKRSFGSWPLKSLLTV